MYSKDVLNFIGIPEWLGHYGPEDTFLMYASQLATKKGYNINQYVLEGLYVSENYVSRQYPYKNSVKALNLKDTFRLQAEQQFSTYLHLFDKNLHNQ
jgi:hypothetical protein